jgi:outer membrane murein-binding lipoprotein Lpp
MNETLTRKEFVKAILLGAGLSGVALVAGCGTQLDPQSLFL